MRAGLFAGLGAIAVLFTPSAALADELDSSSRSVSRAHVEIRVVGELGNNAVFRERVASWFDEQRFDVKVEPVTWLDPRRVLSPERGASVYVWVTLKTKNLARLYFASAVLHSSKPSYLLRDLVLQNGFDEIAAEQIAQALHLSTVALFEGQLESPREEVEASLRSESAPAAKEPKAAPRESEAVSDVPSQAVAESPKIASNARPNAGRAELAFALGYALNFRADEGIGHGPRARLRLGFPHALGVHVRAQGSLPTTQDLADIELQLYGASLLVAASVRQKIGRQLLVEGFAGPGLELVHYTSRAKQGTSLVAGETETELRPQLVLGAFIALGSSTRFGLVPELTLALLDTHYDVTEGSSRTVVGRVPALTPSFGLELEF